MESVIKRIEELSDFDEIDEIEKVAFSDPFSKDLYINDYLNNPYSEYYKLINNNKIIGYFGLWVIYENVQLTTIAVDPKYQRYGYGKVMMDYLVSYTLNKKCENITLEVRVSNEKAISLYKKYNFYKVALRKNYYENGEDAFLMKLDL